MICVKKKSAKALFFIYIVTITEDLPILMIAY